MHLIRQIWSTLLQFPEYLPGVVAALTVLALALPLYFGIWYFLHRRSLPFPWRLRFACLSSFVLFAGLAFIFPTPLASKIPAFVLNAYLFVACGMVAYTIVPLVDVFFIEYYLMGVRGVYISPPLRKIIDVLVFCLSFLPIMRYMLRFNPFALIAIPTIATAVVALALQDTLKTFIAGVGLGHVIRVGDWVAFQDKEGRVVDINWGRTVLRTMDGDLLYIPNTLLLTQTFVNYSTNRAHRLMFKIGVSYKVSPQRVKKEMEQCAREVPNVVKTPAPVAQVFNCVESSIIYALSYWVEDYGQRLETQDQLATRVWEAFREANFELPAPFPTRTIEDHSGDRAVSVK